MHQNYTFSTTLGEKVVSKANRNYHYGQLRHLNINRKFRLWNIFLIFMPFTKEYAYKSKEWNFSFFSIIIIWSRLCSH